MANSGLSGIAPGTVIGNDFEILRPLSEGGMGAVHVVLQRSTGHERALKVMHAALTANADLREKFLREAKISAKIDSEHVVQVIAAGIEEASSAPWLVMELLRGQELRSFIDEGGPPAPADAHEIFTQLCHGLAAAHGVGVVHRDLKPDNIFLATSSRKATAFTVKILDFGIAKILAESKSHGSVVIGSPYWMAPEQTQVGAEISPATDVWALGLIAFFLLTGKVFWRAAHAPDTTPLMVMTEIVLGDMPPASERARELQCEALLPPGFDDWFSRAVARDATKRFADAAAASTAFEQLYDTESGGPTARSPVDATGPQRQPLAASLTQPGPEPKTMASGSLTAVAAPSALPDATSSPAALPAASRPAAGSKAPIALIGAGALVIAAGAGAWFAFGASKTSPASNTSKQETAELRDEPQPSASARASAKPRSSAAPKSKDPAIEGMRLFWDQSDPLNLANSLVLLKRACDAGTQRGCAGLALAKQQGEGIPKDDAGAFLLLDKSCKDGALLGCAGLADAYQFGRGVGKDQPRAIELLDKACAGGEMVGCRKLAASYENGGRGVDKDARHARELYDQACRGGDMFSCTELGHAYLLGNGVPEKSAKLAAEAYTKSCNGGRMVGCSHLADGYAHGVPKSDPKLAADLHTKACNGEVWRSCTRLAAAYEKGVGVTEDRPRALELYRKACKGKDADGCKGAKALGDAAVPSSSARP